MRRDLLDLRKIHQTLTPLKAILFDFALLILFVAALIRLVRSELGW